jgi:hypothetical protein
MSTLIQDGGFSTAHSRCAARLRLGSDLKEVKIICSWWGKSDDEDALERVSRA